MLYSFKIVFPTRQVFSTSALSVVKPTFNVRQNNSIVDAKVVREGGFKTLYEPLSGPLFEALIRKVIKQVAASSSPVVQQPRVRVEEVMAQLAGTIDEDWVRQTDAVFSFVMSDTKAEYFLDLKTGSG